MINPSQWCVQKQGHRTCLSVFTTFTLIELANAIGLDGEWFTRELDSPGTHQALLEEVEFTRRLDVKGFPTLLMEKRGVFTPIQLDYGNVEIVLHQIELLSQ